MIQPGCLLYWNFSSLKIAEWQKLNKESILRNSYWCFRKFQHAVGEEIYKNNTLLTKVINLLAKGEKVHKIHDKTERLSEYFLVHIKDFIIEFKSYCLLYV